MHLHHYRPPVGTGVRGLIVLAPGSRGGMGPGQTSSTIGKFDPAIRCIYPLLARHLAAELGLAVCQFNWRKCPTRKGAPPGTLKSAETLAQGAADVALAVRFLRATHDGSELLPLVLVGFSFGSPAVLAAAKLSCGLDMIPSAATSSATHSDVTRELECASANEQPGTQPAAVACALAVCDDEQRESGRKSGSRAERCSLGPLLGVISLSGGLRVAIDGSAELIRIGDRLEGGASRSRPKDYAGCDSESCVRALADAGVPVLFTHGLADVTVDPNASKAIYDAAPGPKTILWLDGADHHCRARFDELLGTLGAWIFALFHRYDRLRLEQQEAAPLIQTTTALEVDNLPTELAALMPLAPTIKQTNIRN